MENQRRKKVTVEPNISDFIKEMRRKNEVIKQSQRVTNEDEDDVTSTQMMMDDTRARRELKTKESEDKFKCDMCDFKSGSKNLMNRHKKNHQSTKRDPHIWTEKEVLESTSQPEITGTRALPTIRLAEKETCFACDQCEVRTLQKDQMEQHIKSVHVKTKYTCKQCEFTSELKDQLEQHIKSMHVKTKYTCEQCNFTSEQKKKSRNTANLPMKLRVIKEKKKTSKYISKRINCE